MAITISNETKEQIKYLLDLELRSELDIELSAFKLDTLADVCISVLSPVIYNSAIKDAHAFLSEKLCDMEMELYAEERKKR